MPLLNKRSTKNLKPKQAKGSSAQTTVSRMEDKGKLPYFRPSTPFSDCTLGAPILNISSPLQSTFSRVVQIHHRRSRSFSAPLPSEAEIDPDQPWRSREAWLALHARPSSPPLTAKLPSTGAAGWRSRVGGAGFFGGESERSIGLKGRNRAGSTSSSSSDATIIATPRATMGTGEEDWQCGPAIQVYRIKSLESHDSGISSSSEEDHEISFFPKQSSSLRRTATPDDQDDLLPPLLPQTAESVLLPPLVPTTISSRLRKMPSSTTLRDESKPVPWGRRPSTPAVRSSPSPLPTTPPTPPRLMPRDSASSPRRERKLTSTPENEAPPVPVRSPLRGNGTARKLRMGDRDRTSMNRNPLLPCLASVVIETPRLPVPRMDRTVGQQRTWSERSSGEEGGVRRGGWI